MAKQPGEEQSHGAQPGQPRPAQTESQGEVVQDLPGTIVQASGARHPVVVANLSEGGAELRSMRALGVLRNFELLVPSHGVRRKARTAWRGDGVFGVAFED